MVLVRKVTAEEWEIYRDIRLTALRDAPSAFGSTYAGEVTFTEQDWLRRITGSCCLFAHLPEVQDRRPVGLGGGYQETPGVAELVSMWVDPRARGRRVGEALIAAVADWARAETEAKTLHLWVTESNKSAIRLYERYGFKPTGERQPLPSDPALSEFAMSLDLR
jgi:ribosomal protein S18 acetylase RimI-like enzyme